MRIACLQHVPFEGPAEIGSWAASRGYPSFTTHLFANEPLPPLAAFDVLVILGGPMSVNDEPLFDWLQPEKEFIRHAIEGGRRVLGICLGAQLIASALGAKVFSNRDREIGWFPVRRTSHGTRHAAFASLPDTFTPLHWHGETHDLPAGAIPLATSVACAQQAFSIGDQVLGLQFHLESTPESVEALVRNCPGDLAPGRFVQDAHAMLTAREHFQQSNQLMVTLLDRFVAG
jgi:GMP synthase (glutamine-hydrolysing)